MASLLGSLAGGLGKGIGQMAQVREENNRRKQDKQFRIDAEKRRAAREKALAEWKVEQDKEMRKNQREFTTSENEKNREYQGEVASSKAAAEQRQQEAEKIEKIFERLDSEYQAKRKEILEYAPKDLATGQPQMTEAVQKELARLDQAYQSQKSTMVEQYGESLIGTSYEPYYLNRQAQGSRGQQQGLLQQNMGGEPDPQPKPQPSPAASTQGAQTEDLATELRRSSYRGGGAKNRAGSKFMEETLPNFLSQQSDINKKYGTRY